MAFLACFGVKRYGYLSFTHFFCFHLQKSSSSASSEASETCQSVSECSSPTTVSTLIQTVQYWVTLKPNQKSKAIQGWHKQKRTVTSEYCTQHDPLYQLCKSMILIFVFCENKILVIHLSLNGVPPKVLVLHICIQTQHTNLTWAPFGN